MPGADIGPVITVYGEWGVPSVSLLFFSDRHRLRIEARREIAAIKIRREKEIRRRLRMVRDRVLKCNYNQAQTVGRLSCGKKVQVLLMYHAVPMPLNTNK